MLLLPSASRQRQQQHKKMITLSSCSRSSSTINSKVSTCSKQKPASASCAVRHHHRWLSKSPSTYSSSRSAGAAAKFTYRYHRLPVTSRTMTVMRMPPPVQPVPNSSGDMETGGLTPPDPTTTSPPNHNDGNGAITTKGEEQVDHRSLIGCGMGGTALSADKAKKSTTATTAASTIGTVKTLSTSSPLLSRLRLNYATRRCPRPSPPAPTPIGRAGETAKVRSYNNKYDGDNDSSNKAEGRRQYWVSIRFDDGYYYYYNNNSKLSKVSKNNAGGGGVYGSSRHIHFNDRVEVLEIPNRHEYSNEEREAMWSGKQQRPRRSLLQSSSSVLPDNNSIPITKRLTVRQPATTMQPDPFYRQDSGITASS